MLNLYKHKQFGLLLNILICKIMEITEITDISQSLISIFMEMKLKF